MLVGGLPFSVPLPLSKCVVPSGINGPVAIWITSDNQPLLNNPIDRAVDKQVAGPTITFIDTKLQLLGQMAHTPQSTPPPVVTTVNLDQATSIINNASPSSSVSSSVSSPASSPTPTSPGSY